MGNVGEKELLDRDLVISHDNIDSRDPYVGTYLSRDWSYGIESPRYKKIFKEELLLFVAKNAIFTALSLFFMVVFFHQPMINCIILFILPFLSIFSYLFFGSGYIMATARSFYGMGCGDTVAYK